MRTPALNLTTNIAKQVDAARQVAESAVAARASGDTRVEATFRAKAEEILAGIEGALAERSGDLDTPALQQLRDSAKGLDEVYSKLSDSTQTIKDQAKAALPESTVWVDEWFGDVNNAAAQLAERAIDTGKPHAMDFNGELLVAQPADSAKESAEAALQGWRAGRDERRTEDPIQRAQYKIEDFVASMEDQSAIAKLAKTQPRSLDEVIVAMKEFETSGHYGNYITAGLCELKHPEEIKEFAMHYVDVIPEMADDVGPKEARERAVTNMSFWAFEREEIPRGTESAWRDALLLANGHANTINEMGTTPKVAAATAPKITASDITVPPEFNVDPTALHDGIYLASFVDLVTLPEGTTLMNRVGDSFTVGRDEIDWFSFDSQSGRSTFGFPAINVDLAIRDNLRTGEGPVVAKEVGRDKAIDQAMYLHQLTGRPVEIRSRYDSFEAGVDESGTLTTSFDIGSHIDQAKEELAALAKRFGIPVEGEFNDKILRAAPKANGEVESSERKKPERKREAPTTTSEVGTTGQTSAAEEASSPARVTRESLARKTADIAACLQGLSPEEKVDRVAEAAIDAFSLAAHEFGITGFQAGFAGWRTISLVTGNDAPQMKLRGENILYPQYNLDKEAWSFLTESVRKQVPNIAAARLKVGLGTEKQRQLWAKQAENADTKEVEKLVEFTEKMANRREGLISNNQDQWFQTIQASLDGSGGYDGTAEGTANLAAATILYLKNAGELSDEQATEAARRVLGKAQLGSSEDSFYLDLSAVLDRGTNAVSELYSDFSEWYSGLPERYRDQARKKLHGGGAHPHIIAHWAKIAGEDIARPGAEAGNVLQERHQLVLALATQDYFGEVSPTDLQKAANHIDTSLQTGKSLDDIWTDRLSFWKA